MPRRASIPAPCVTVGKFKPPVGLERLQSSARHPLHRAWPADQPRAEPRSRRAALGRFRRRRLRYQVGYFNGVTDGQSSDNLATPDVEVDTARRLRRARVLPAVHQLGQLQPARPGLRRRHDLGGCGRHRRQPALSAYRSPGQQSVFAYRANTATGVTPNNATFANGERLRLAPQLYYYRGSFGLLGEYTQVEQDVSRAVGGTTLSRHADELRLAGAVLVVRHAAKKKPSAASRRAAPSSPASPAGAPGNSWRDIHELDVDDDAFAGGANSFANPLTAVTKDTAYGVGVNWYPWNTVKLSLNYELTSFEGGAATGDRADEQALFSRFAINY